MFSFRRKGSKKDKDTSQIRTSPSLPEISAHPGGLIPWPEALVDVASIRKTPGPPTPTRGAAKTSIQGVDSETILPFHKPFRGSPGKQHKGHIFELYMSSPPSAFSRNRNLAPVSAGRLSLRKSMRVAPTFNLMVVGGRGTGKTSLLRLLLETADVSPNATVDQRTALDGFLRGSPKPTESIQTACVEICESRFDRIMLSVIDTPGLDFGEGRELKLERQVTSIMKYIDSQYADTMSEESKVIRQSKADQHIHLCIYMIEPSSVMTPAARRAKSSLPLKSQSQATVSYRVPDLVPDDSDESDDEKEARLTMSPAEIRVLRRLSTRCNVLPVIAQADSLTDDKLAAVKQAVRAGMKDAGLDFGVFGPRQKAPRPRSASLRQTRFPDENGRSPHRRGTDGNSPSGEISSDEDDSEERTSRPVVRLRNRRALSRSQSRRSLADAEDRSPQFPDEGDTESLANMRFSAAAVARADLTPLMPFALIAPQPSSRRLPRPDSMTSSIVTANGGQASEDGHAPSSVSTEPMTPASVHSVLRNSFLSGPPDDLRGVFVRKFRWGTVDVLNPEHCDFAALRTAVLSTHLKPLKVRTKEVLYEKYRTEKLLARRATSHISEEEQKRLLEDLGL